MARLESAIYSSELLVAEFKPTVPWSRICIYIYVCECVCVYLCVYVCVCLRMCVCMYVCVYMYRCVCIVVYVCLCVNVCVVVCGNQWVGSSLELLRESFQISYHSFLALRWHPPSFPYINQLSLFGQTPPTPSVITLYHYSSVVFQHASMCFFLHFFLYFLA